MLSEILKIEDQIKELKKCQPWEIKTKADSIMENTIKVLIEMELRIIELEGAKKNG